MVNSREDFHLQDFAHAGRTNRPLAVATLSIPALKGEVFREFSINMLLPNARFAAYFHHFIHAKIQKTITYTIMRYKTYSVSPLSEIRKSDG